MSDQLLADLEILAGELKAAGVIRFDYESGLTNIGLVFGQVTAPAPVLEQNKPEEKVIQILSPGMGYVRFAYPEEAQLFCSVGDRVALEQTVAILSDGVVYQPIKSPVEGIIKDVFVSDGQRAGFGDPLFSVIARCD
ncbi:acetyl-CoA carboxylase biotin carboxyl carrier protein [Gluconobacter cerinus]|uniref:acetyl-CoA carboxylase biotin carboxyl carrier protein n=1 Tax=Gluconobacter cerinus TaxID=38307 RepID=UPI0039EB7C0D